MMKRVLQTKLSQRAVGAEKTAKQLREKHFGACGRKLARRAIRTARLSRQDVMKRAVLIYGQFGWYRGSLPFVPYGTKGIFIFRPPESIIIKSG